MKELTQKQTFDFLSNNGIENFIGVPDSTLKHFIELGFKKNGYFVEFGATNGVENSNSYLLEIKNGY